MFEHILEHTLESVKNRILMTQYQARILLILLRAAEHDAWRIPTGKQLAQLLYDKKVSRFDNEVKKISGRTASSHIKRLQETEHCFRKEGKTWYLLPEKLVTEPETALFILVVNEIIDRNPDGRMPKSYLPLLQSKLSLNLQDFSALLDFVYTEGYFEVFPTRTEYIRACIRTRRQKGYLELLASPFNPVSLAEELRREAP